MTISKKELEILGYGDTWEFFISAYNAIESIDAYMLLIKHLLTQKENSFKEVLSGKRIIRDDEKKMFPPGDWLNIEGTNVSISFFITHLGEAFFQMGQNFFDYIAQIVAAIYIKGLKPERVDFRKIESKKRTLENKDIEDLISGVSKSSVFQYIQDYSNTIKHNHEIQIGFWWNTDTLQLSSKIPSFTKRVSDDETHEYIETDMISKMEESKSFITQTFVQLVSIVFKGNN